MFSAKLQPPRLQAHLIDRRRALGPIVPDPPSVTFVQAPAGWGKTTMVAQWCESLGHTAVAWVSFDKGDDEPIAFWQYVTAAIDAAYPGSLRRTIAALSERSPTFGSSELNTLVGELSDLEQPLVVDIDDLHHIEDTECIDMLRVALARLTGRIRFVLISRGKPPPGISRLTARGGAHATTSDLGFSERETSALLQEVGAVPSAELTALIQDHTDGWPIAVYLAAIHIARGGETRGLASMGLLEAFLKDEILGGLPEGDREFLLRSSVVDVLDASLAEALTGDPDAGTVLVRLDESSLLVAPIGSSGGTYRLHHVLRTLLRKELAHDPHLLERQHRLATLWYLGHGDAPRAIDHSFGAGDQQWTASLLSEHWYELVMSGRVESVWQWIERLGEDSLVDHPFVVLAAAWTASFRGDGRAARRLASLSKSLVDDSPPPDGTASYASARALMLAALGIDGVTASVHHAETALQLEPEMSPRHVTALGLAGTAALAEGNDEKGRRLLEQAIETSSRPDAILTYCMGQLALADVRRSDWDGAERWSSDGVELISTLGLGHLISSGAALSSSAMVAAHQGRSGSAKALLNRLGPLLARATDAVPYDACQLHAAAAETYLALGSSSAASAHADIASTYLKALGDGGVLEQQLRELDHRLDAPSAPTVPLKDALSERELEVLRLLVTDLSIRDIGDRLYVSRNTVKSHIGRLYRKLNVSSRSAAVARAHSEGVIGDSTD